MKKCESFRLLLWLLLSFPILILPGRLFAQTCGTKEVNEKLILNHPQYRNESTALELEIKNRIIAQSTQRGGIVVYPIPVVVHVIHLGEPEGSGSNISTAQIEGAIDGLNDRFRNIIGNSLDIGIEFCLAARDPGGNPTTGINRVNGSSDANFASEGIEWDGSGGASEFEVKLLSIWPRADYYNIWVVHGIYGPVAGYAYYPTTYTLEGAVMEAAYMTNSSKVLTHEMGHAFDLAHTFDGDNDGASCPSNTDCSLEGDQICDTPPHKRGDCGASNPCSVSGVFANSRYNYMSYCGSTDRFTPNQQDRMEAAVNSSARITLLSSLGCVASACSTACADSDPCTFDLCEAGSCMYEPLDCDDGNACTNNLCTGFDCFYTPVDCDDGNPCTLDYCSGGCENQPLDCSDGSPCTADFCVVGQCYSEPVDCDDADLCTNDVCSPVETAIYIDYDISDEQATQLSGGTYSRSLWTLNTNFSETNQSNSGKLEWAVTRFNWLEDVNTQQQYLYSENEVRIDSIDVLFTHQNVTGTPDSIVILIYVDEAGVYLDNQENILNAILYADTIITSASLSPNLTTPITLRVTPDFTLPQGQQFMVGVNFYGSASNTFRILAGYGNRCSGGCAAYPSVFDINSYWKIIYWVSASNISGVNNLGFDCNSSSSIDPLNCEKYYIQNYAISANLTMLSREDYQCLHTPAVCTFNISGAILTETNVPVSGVSVILSGTESDTIVTGADGLYSFTVAQGGSYTVTPSKSNDTTTNNGITSVDISLIRRHVLGGTPLNSPYKIIAADANNLANVTTGDIPLVRIVVLNNLAKFPPTNSRLWEFVSGFTDEQNPFSFLKTRTYNNLTSNQTEQDFIGVKIGDVNNSWISTIH